MRRARPLARPGLAIVTVCAALAACGAPLGAQEAESVQALADDTSAAAPEALSESASRVAVTEPVAEMLVKALESVDARSPAAALPLRQVSAGDAAALIGYEPGHPPVVVLYYASCPRSHVALALAREVAERYERTGVTLRAFAWGHTRSEIRGYLPRLALTHQPLLPRP